MMLPAPGPGSRRHPYAGRVRVEDPVSWHHLSGTTVTCMRREGGSGLELGDGVETPVHSHHFAPGVGR